VTHRARTMPRPSQTKWTFVPKPPCERPSAWSCGSCTCIDSGPPRHGEASGFFFRPGGGPAGADHGSIDQPQVAVDEPALVEAQQQGVEDPGPGAVLPPAVEAVVGGLPGAEASGEVTPGGAGVQVPEDAVDHAAVRPPG